jgi:hypothetical protein
MISAARDGVLYCTYGTDKSRMLEILAFDEQPTFVFCQFFSLLVNKGSLALFPTAVPG